MITDTLKWVESASADTEHPDVEADLAPQGNPGGAAWASVALNGAVWTWSVYRHWTWEQIDADPTSVLATGTAPTSEDCCAAVEAWIHSAVSS